MLQLIAAADPLDHVLPHELFHIGNFPVTNQMLMAVVAAVLMLLIFPTLFRGTFVDAPRGPKNFFESILEFLRIEVFRPALKEHTDRFVPFLWTLFFFILFCNLLGTIPLNEIVTLFKGRDVAAKDAAHFSGTATGTLTTTGALAVCAFLFIHLNGIVQVFRSLVDGTYGHHVHHEEHSSDGGHGHEAAHDLEHHRGDALAADVPNNFHATTNPTAHYNDDHHAGGSKPHGDHAHAHAGKPAAVAALLAVPLYLWNFAPHPFKPAPGASPIGWLADIPVWGLLLVLELVGALIKPFALMIRLFANMIAGHIVLAALILLIPVASSFLVQAGVALPVMILSLLIRVLELFVSFLQAYIFTFLTTLFIASAVAPEH